MSPSLSEPGRFVVVGNPESRRVALFQDALSRHGCPPAVLVSYTDLLAGNACLSDSVRRGDIVRIESPGRDWAVEKALLLAGSEEEDEDSFERIPPNRVHALAFDRGEILCPRQWYLGYRRVLRRIEEELAACAYHGTMTPPASIAAMFDKPGCHRLLEEHGIPVPRTLGVVRSYDHLIARMAEKGWARVFVKLAHGSSASGVIAYQTSGERHQATTTVEMVSQDGRLRLFNSRRVRVYRDQAEIAVLVDALCRHRVCVEQWLPKAGIRGKTFDLRVVVIAGRVRHTVVRLSQGPLTNLHLLNERAGAEVVRARMTGAAWDALRADCERTLRGCFPGSAAYAGLDVLVTPDFRRHAVLEVNAFGDLLPGTLDNGQDTYAAEITAAIREKPGPLREAVAA